MDNCEMDFENRLVTPEYTPDEAEVVKPKFKSCVGLGVTKQDVEPGLTGLYL